MKTLLTLVGLVALRIGAVATPMAAPTTAPTDSLIIKFGKSSRIAVYAPTKEQLKTITQYDLNQIVRDMVGKLDSVPEGQVYIIHEQNGKEYRRDSVSVVSRQGGNVTISIKNDAADSSGYTYEPQQFVALKLEGQHRFSYRPQHLGKRTRQLDLQR